MEVLFAALVFFAIGLSYLLIRDGVFERLFDPHVSYMKKVRKHLSRKRKRRV